MNYVCETIISIVAYVVVDELNKLNSAAAAAWMFSEFYRLITVGKFSEEQSGLTSHPLTSGTVIW